MESWLYSSLAHPHAQPRSVFTPAGIPRLQDFAHTGPTAWITLPLLPHLAPPTFKALLCCHLSPWKGPTSTPPEQNDGSLPRILWHFVSVSG